MNKKASIARVVIIHLLTAIAVIGLLSEPAEPCWLLKLILSKGIGLAAAYAAYRLGWRWKNDAYIHKLTHIWNDL